MAILTLGCLFLAVFSFIRGHGGIIDVRLVNGTKPNEGTILYTEDCQTWNTSCGQYHSNRHVGDATCRHLGFPAANRVILNSPFGDYGPPTSQIMCSGDRPSLSNCSLMAGCYSDTPGGVVCYENNYLGCFIDQLHDRVLKGRRNHSFIGLTIAKCLDFCRLDEDMAFAGVTNSLECYCGNASPNFTRRARDDECNYICDGSTYENCGGLNRIAIFNLTADPNPSPNQLSSPCSTTSPPISTMSTSMSSSMPTFSQITAQSTINDVTSDITETENGSGQTTTGQPSTQSSEENTKSSFAAAVGGGVAAAGVLLISIVVAITVCRYKCKPKQRQKQEQYLHDMTDSKMVPPMYESTIEGFYEQTGALGNDALYMDVENDDLENKQQEKVQHKERTAETGYVNIAENPQVLEHESNYEVMSQESSYENVTVE